MLVRIYRIFVVAPAKDIWAGILDYLTFLYRFSLNTLLCREVIGKSVDDIAIEAFKIFKFLIFCILANLTINEAFGNRDSDLIREMKSESSYLLFFIVSFLLCFYLAAAYSALRKNEYLKVVISRDWLLTMMIATVIFQVTGVLNPGESSQIEIEDTISTDLAGLAFSYLLLFIFQFRRMLRSKLVRWFDIFFCLICFSLFIFLLICKAAIIQLLIS